MRTRLPFFVLLLALLATPLLAQTSEFGVFVNHTTFSKNTASDPAIGLTEADVKFDSKAGWGVSYNRFLSPDTSFELSAQDLKGDARVTITAGGVTGSESGGSLELRQYDAAYHFYVNPRGRVRAYIGGGVALLRSGKLKVAADPADNIEATTISLKSKTTWLAVAGVDISVTPSVAIALAAKYTRYRADLDTTPDDLFQHLKLDPVSVSAGLRWRF